MTQRTGFIYAFAAYGLWGMFPFYFRAIGEASPWEISVFRVLLVLAFCLVVLATGQRWKNFVAAARQPRTVLLFAIAGVLLYTNWTIFAYAVVSGHVIDSSLGYFINPILTIALGVIFLNERLRVTQWTAVAVAALAVVVLTIGYGQVPVIGLSLAMTFGVYGLLKKRGGAVDAVTGLTLETVPLAPLALGQLVFFSVAGELSFLEHGPSHAILLSLAGVVTAVPLLFFAAAARRIPLVYLGLIQFLTPIMTFLFGIFITQEPMPIERLMGFTLVWLACIILAVDALSHARRSRKTVVADELDPLAEVR